MPADVEIQQAIEDLTGIDLQGSPPCGVLRARSADICGYPSVARVRMKCSAHGPVTLFVCRDHKQDAESGALQCTHCRNYLDGCRPA